MASTAVDQLDRAEDGFGFGGPRDRVVKRDPRVRLQGMGRSSASFLVVVRLTFAALKTWRLNVKMTLVALATVWLSAVAPDVVAQSARGVRYDVVIRGGTVYDGSGRAPFSADVAVAGDRIAKIAPHIASKGRVEIDAHDRAVAPGFINMLAHPEQSLLIDGRALSDLVQGVTLEVMGESSMGPLSPAMKRDMIARQGDLKYNVEWTTLGQYLNGLQGHGISVNIASFVAEPTVRKNFLGEDDVQPTPSQLQAMRVLVRQAMEEGALGLTTALIYAPATFAKTPEITAMAKVSGQCGGIYIAHIRNEGDRLLEAIQETIDVAKASGAPAEIYHFKQGGRDNWSKLDPAIKMIEAARAAGVRITADMYPYVAGATGLDAAMPPWVQDGGLEKWIARMKEPEVRGRVIAEMRNPHPGDWDNLYGAAGAEGTLLLGFRNPTLKPLAGKTLADVAKLRGESPEETAIDLVIEDGTRVAVAYFLMNEDNIRREIGLGWMSFGSDADAPAPEGVFLLSQRHPRAYGNFARILGRYVRDEHALTLADAVRRLASLPAENLSLKDRGALKVGYFADVVVFDPATIADKATYAQPNQLAVGMEHVLVNGRFALRDGQPTAMRPGRVVRGRAWIGAPGGGCRANAAAWTWAR